MTITRIPISLVFLGLTLFSAVTHAQRAKEVIIINDASKPVPVTTDGFVRTPFAIQLTGPGTPTEDCFASFVVDPAKRLVIEGFSLETNVIITKTTVGVVTNGVVVNHFYPRQSGDDAASTWHHVRLYADPGSDVDFLLTTPSTGALPCTFGVSGYLIDPSSPSLAP
jgi:hypothetical protein